MERREIVYRGSPALAGLFVKELRDAGLHVQWTPPAESRHVDAVGQVVIPILVGVGVGTGTAASIAAVQQIMDRFRKRFPKSEIEWREKDGYR